jgi:hypothetical protein
MKADRLVVCASILAACLGWHCKSRTVPEDRSVISILGDEASTADKRVRAANGRLDSVLRSGPDSVCYYSGVALLGGKLRGGLTLYFVEGHVLEFAAEFPSASPSASGLFQVLQNHVDSLLGSSSTESKASSDLGWSYDAGTITLKSDAEPSGDSAIVLSGIVKFATVPSTQFLRLAKLVAQDVGVSRGMSLPDSLLFDDSAVQKK